MCNSDRDGKRASENGYKYAVSLRKLLKADTVSDIAPINITPCTKGDNAVSVSYTEIAGTFNVMVDPASERSSMERLVPPKAAVSGDFAEKGTLKAHGEGFPRIGSSRDLFSLDWVNSFGSIFKSRLFYFPEHGYLAGAIVGVVTIMIFVMLNVHPSFPEQPIDGDWASVTLVETVPEQVILSPQFMSTTDGWLHMIRHAKKEIRIACFYMTLTGGQKNGQDVYDALVDAAKRNIDIWIVENKPVSNDSVNLAKYPNVHLRILDMNQLTGGILHTKFILIDQIEMYVGSANMDWRSLQQVKEFGAVVKHSRVLANDLNKIFTIYWDMAAPDTTKFPREWKQSLDTRINAETPAIIEYDWISAHWFFSITPPEMMTPGRSWDLTVVLDRIANAKKSVCISVMDLFPTSLYNNPQQYWGPIFDALKNAAFEKGSQNIPVRLLVSHWNHTRGYMFDYLAGMAELPNIEVKYFQVPDLVPGPQYPFSRVNHAKYMVTDSDAFITTSNWSWDYFMNTCGVSLNTNHTKVVSDVQSLFNRDWDSEYAHDLCEIRKPAYCNCDSGDVIK